MADSPLCVAWHRAWNRPFANHGSEIELRFVSHLWTARTSTSTTTVALPSSSMIN
ncbi:uncharacterized protein H6S33_012635 [Morchella sextelata]|uniref:uncharacterized protein n=1 Tax=Morchella sextelata TaxID=1174677 RepID=UPI001D0390D9|nr:uncharacterized protein H6S33_012635 [Morchella sextelata]KAH0610089.1 hypothetical protein H6S33_012635 [Morchella sextelata]